MVGKMLLPVKTSNACWYLKGSANTDGSIRFRANGTALNFEYRDSGSWQIFFRVEYDSGDSLNSNDVDILLVRGLSNALILRAHGDNVYFEVLVSLVWKRIFTIGYEAGADTVTASNLFYLRGDASTDESIRIGVENNDTVTFEIRKSGTWYVFFKQQYS